MELYIEECLESVYNQENLDSFHVEISIFDDSSSDSTLTIVNSLKEKFLNKKIHLILNGQSSGRPKGVGFAKNAAVRASSGRYLCFLDADDVMLPERLKFQYEAAEKLNDFVLIGSKFTRIPENSTRRYAKWANNLSPSQLKTQIYTSNGPTLVAPTWFCSRKLFDAVGGFIGENPVGFPEDLEFFYKALNLGAFLFRVERELVRYRYHATCASFSVSENTIFGLRVAEFERRVLNDVGWSNFSIWNAGKQGKLFYKRLNAENRGKVVAFCDVDEKKLKHGYYESYERIDGRIDIGRRIPIVSYKIVGPPVVICVKLDLTDGEFEKLLHDKCWVEGRDFYFLS